MSNKNLLKWYQLKPAKEIFPDVKLKWYQNLLIDIQCWLIKRRLK